MKAIKPESIASGFKKTGICPLDSGPIMSVLPSSLSDSDYTQAPSTTKSDEKGSSGSTGETGSTETPTVGISQLKHK